MDRQTVYAGQLPRSNDFLKGQQNAMVALAKLSEAVFGTAIAVDGLSVTPTTPASLNVILTEGQIYQLENLEASQWSGVDADTAHSIFKQGILLDPVTFGITPPGTVGYSQVFLVQVQYQDLDSGSTVLPYYNAANPSVPFSGPGNAGTAQNTVRQGYVAAQIKAGIAAATGSQVAPTADAGWTGIYTVTVANGASSITSGNIAKLSSAPFIPVKLPDVPAGVQSGKWQYGTDTGTANAMVAALNPVPTQLTPGMTVHIKKGASANTGATTLNVGLGANAVKRTNGAALQADDLPANSINEFVWDGAAWQMTNFQGVTAQTTNNNTYVLTIPYCVDSGTPNNIVANFTPAITALAAGDMFKIKLANTITGSAYVTINALAAVQLVRGDGSATQANDGYAGQILVVEYDGAKLQMVNSWQQQTVNNTLTIPYAADSGSASNTIVANYSPAITSLTVGDMFKVKLAFNITGASTFKVNNLVAKSIKRGNGAATQSGDGYAGQILLLEWDGTNFQVANSLAVQQTNITNELTIPYVNDSGAASNSVVANFSPAITSIAAGDMFKVKLANKITGPATLKINAMSTIALVRPDGTPLRNGDGVVGQVLILEYDGANVQVVNINPAAGGFVPGCVYQWPMETAPDGTFECNGGAVSRSTYARLFAIIGTAYGDGNGSTTFNLPDYRGEFLRGWSHGTTKDPDRGSRTDRGDGTAGDHVGTKESGAAGPVSLTGANVTIDNPQVTPGNGGVPAGPLTYGSSNAAGDTGIALTSSGYVGSVAKITGTTSISGNSGSTETRPRNINVMYVIAY